MLFSIEGNIGSGKSSLSKILKEQLNNTVIFDEPVQDWNSFTDENNNTVLKNFYSDKTKYGFQFNMVIYATKFNYLTTINKAKLTILERSYLSDFNVFLKMLYDNKNISKIEYKISELLFTTTKSLYPINKIIYLRTSFEVCYNRYLKRNRQGEILDKDYLLMLHNYHDHYFLHHPDVIIIDGDIEFEDDKQRQDVIVNQIKQVLNINL
jgi:deoxyguanosine kinase